MQTPSNPSNTQLRREAEAARKRRPIFTGCIRVRTRTAMVTKEDERRRRDAPFRARVGWSPSAMPQANAEAIATAAASWHSLQPQQGFDVKCLREKIEQMHFRNFIADAWPSDFFRFPERARQHRQIARKRGWIAGEVYNFFGAEVRELLSSFRAQSGSRRIKEYEVWFFFGFLQKLFRMLVVRQDGYACNLR